MLHLRTPCYPPGAVSASPWHARGRGYDRRTCRTVLDEPTAEDLLAEMHRARRQRGTAHAGRERLVEMHLPMAKDITRRYRYRGEPVEDLRQAAYVGLMKAINGFDAELGHELPRLRDGHHDRRGQAPLPGPYLGHPGAAASTRSGAPSSTGRSPTSPRSSAASPRSPSWPSKMSISEEEMLLTLDASAAYSTLSLDAPARCRRRRGRAG